MEASNKGVAALLIAMVVMFASGQIVKPDDNSCMEQLLRSGVATTTENA
ncbi:hypothetical protein Acr_23g0008150 [Actinidia rufa]|uniref:Uncharacterized protein n=1 Tax=Actinidia rufa TaxID=165716 RepID=A0A7J0GNQ6_9ERIC|nr:hypothetical protein Acr_23g0008150 [Actinidia rufa]